MKKRNYNTSGNRVKKILLNLTISVLFITLLRSQIPAVGNLAFDSNPPSAGAGNTHCFFPADRLIHAGGGRCHNFSSAGRSVPPQGGRIEFYRQAVSAAGTPLFDTEGRQPTCPLQYYDWLDATIEKIWQEESSGRIVCPDGDGGLAAGPLQIHKDVVDDVNRYWGTQFTYSDRYDLNKARQIAKLYIAMWFEIHKEEIACRIFNGGPRGWQKKSTDEYWEKIQKEGK